VVLSRDPVEIDVVPLLGCREPFSSLSHLAGAVVFAGLAIRLIRRGNGDRVRTISLAVFAISTVQLLLTSAVYHATWPGQVRHLMLRADVSSIFLLIAASMTPGQAILFRGLPRSLSLILIWTAGIGGVIWRTLAINDSPGSFGIFVFLVFGWCSVIAGIVLWRRFGWNFVQPAVLSGLVYSLGAIGLMLDWPTMIPGIIGPHEVWHIAVLIALGLQWRFVFQFASGHVGSIEY
jgi:hemolysin III